MEPHNLVIKIDLGAFAEFPEEEEAPPLPNFLPDSETIMHRTDTSFYHLYNPQQRLPGEKRLMLGILSNAINDLDSAKYEEDRKEALQWLTGKMDVPGYVFSFESICEELGYDKETFSKAIEQIYHRFEKVRVRVKTTK